MHSCYYTVLLFSEESLQWKDKNDEDELKRLTDPHAVIHVKVTNDFATDSLFLKPSSMNHIAKSKNEAEKLTKAQKDIESNIIFDIGENDIGEVLLLCKVLSKNIPSLENRSVYITKVPVDAWLMKKGLFGWGKITNFGKKYAIFSEETGRLYEEECLEIGKVVFERLEHDSREDSLAQNLDTLIIKDEEGSIGSKEKQGSNFVYVTHS